MNQADHRKACSAGCAAKMAQLRTALADAVCRPKGVIPDSAQGLLLPHELEQAEARRPTSAGRFKKDNQPGEK